MQNRKCQTPHTIFPLVHTQTSQFVDIEILGTKYDEMQRIDFCPYSPSPEEKAFFEAVRSGNSAEVEELINVKHVDVDCTNVNGETALQIAVKREAFDMVQTLLRNKADIGAAFFELR